MYSCIIHLEGLKILPYMVSDLTQYYCLQDEYKMLINWVQFSTLDYQSELFIAHKYFHDVIITISYLPTRAWFCIAIFMICGIPNAFHIQSKFCRWVVARSCSCPYTSFFVKWLAWFWAVWIHSPRSPLCLYRLCNLQSPIKIIVLWKQSYFETI